MKTFVILFFIALSQSGAQVLEPQSTAPSGGAPGSRQPGSATGPSGGNFLGNEIGVFDPSTEMFTWDGKSFNVTDNRLIRARFEKYLNAPAASSQADKEYRAILDQVLAKLSPTTNAGKLDVASAIYLLPKASSYPIDARLCDSISQALYAAYAAQRNQWALQKMNDDLQAEAKEIQRDAEFFGIEMADGGSLSKSSKKSGQGTESTESMNKNIVSWGSGTALAKRILEIEAVKKTNSAKMGVSELQAKAEFQALILQFLAQRRFEHVIIACRFYRGVFSDGLTTLQVQEGSDVDKLFGQGLGTNPTLSTIESMANEVIRDVDEGVDAFNYLVSANEIESASKRLAESFFIGEYLPKIRTLELEKKRRVQAFVRDSYQLKSALEVRDFAMARELVERMRVEARDFDYSKPKAAIESYTRMSDSYIAKAKLAAQAGDMDTYQKEMKIAIEAWPMNPKLDEIGDTVNMVTDVRIKAKNDFDALVSQNNKRQIFLDKGRLGSALYDDPERVEKLEKIVNEVVAIDTGLASINELVKSGNAYGGWELANKLRNDYGDDPQLSKVMTDLTVKVSDLAQALENARTLEKRGELGASLSWYLTARRIYPTSIAADEGVNRTVDAILPTSGNPNSVLSSSPTSSSGAAPASSAPAPSALDL